MLKRLGTEEKYKDTRGRLDEFDIIGGYCLKIDYVCIGYWPVIGGTETVVKNLAERMVRRGHDVTVHASTYNLNYGGALMHKEVINGVNVIRYRLLPFYVFLPKIRNPEIVYLFSYGDNFIIQSFLRHSRKFISSPIGE